MTHSADPLTNASPIPTDLEALIVARLCHDLASPLGAISNGVELLEMTQGGGPEVSLVAQSARQATARLRLFRLAFGRDSADQMMSMAEITSLLRAHCETARCWTDYAVGGDLPRAHAKLLVLGLLCLETALPWGGNVRIEATEHGYQLQANGERLKVDSSTWAILGDEDGASPVTPATVQFASLREAAVRQSLALTVTQMDTRLTLSLKDERALM